MSEILICGDIHGNHPWAKKVIDVAVKEGLNQIIQLGDFGIWPGQRGVEYLNILSRYLLKKNINLYFVPGNHEDWDQIDSWADKPRNADGHYEVRPNLFYAGKVNVWEWEAKRFASVGGAVSIDRKYRKPKVDWWKQEQLTNAEMIQAKALGRVDYLFTHDAPTCIPANWLKQDVESELHRQLMTRVGSALQPKSWFHGHYHWFNHYGFPHDNGWSDVYALDADDNASAYAGGRIHEHVTILNVENGDVRFLDS